MLKSNMQVTEIKHKEIIVWEDKANNKTSDTLDTEEKDIKEILKYEKYIRHKPTIK